MYIRLKLFGGFVLFLIKFKQNILIHSEASVHTSNLIWEEENLVSLCERMYHDEKGYYILKNKQLRNMVLSICFVSYLLFLFPFFIYVKLSLLYQLSQNMPQPYSVQFFQHVICSVHHSAKKLSIYCIFNFQ